MKQAPILILVFKPKEDNWIIGDTLSIGAAIEHICLRATDLGLGSLWISANKKLYEFKRKIKIHTRINYKHIWRCGS